MDQLGLTKLFPFLKLYSNAVPNFYCFVNEQAQIPLKSTQEWNLQKKKFHKSLNEKMSLLIKKQGKKNLQHSIIRFRHCQSKPVNTALVEKCFMLTDLPLSKNPSFIKAMSFPSQRTKRDRSWLDENISSQIALRSHDSMERPTLRFPHFKSDPPVLTQMLVVNILKSPNLDVNNVDQSIDARGCKNCIRHLAKTLLTNFTTSVMQKWSGLAERVFRVTSKKPDGPKISIRTHFNDLRPSKMQIKLDPLFWFNRWCNCALFFDSILNFTRRLKLSYSELPRTVSLRFDGIDLGHLFPEVKILDELKEKMNLNQTIRSIQLTKSGQFQIIVDRKPCKKSNPNLDFLKKYSTEIEKVLKSGSHKRRSRTIHSNSQDTFSVVVADPGKKNLFEGLSLNFYPNRVKIEPFRLTASKWRQVAGTTDLIHSWNQALKDPNVRDMEISLRYRVFHRYRVRQKRTRQSALDSTLTKIFKANQSGPIYFIVGDWVPSSTTLKGHPSSEVSQILNRISSKHPVLLQNEHNTTKLCSCCQKPLKNVPHWRIPHWFLKKLGILRLRNWLRNRRKRKKTVELTESELSTDELIEKCSSNLSWAERLPHIKNLFLRCASIFGRPGCFSSWTRIDVDQSILRSLKIRSSVSHDIKLCPSGKRFVARDYDAAISIGLKFFENL